MTVTDRQRNELYQAFERTIGEGPADTLMSLLPPVGWADVATKHDLDSLRVATKQDLDNLRVDFEHLREQMATKTDLAELRAYFESGLKEQTRTLIFGLAALNTTFLAALLTGARLFGA